MRFSVGLHKTFCDTSSLLHQQVIIIIFFSGKTGQRGPGPPHSSRFVDQTQ